MLIPHRIMIHLRLGLHLVGQDVDGLQIVDVIYLSGPIAPQ